MIQAGVLYILMRTDLASMNPGKAMAQASHASNAFVHKGQSHAGVVEWKGSKQGFGTVIVLGVTGEELEIAVQMSNNIGFISDIVHDPAYPLRDDGDVTHFIPLDTCGYVFGYKDDPELVYILSRFELHP